MHKVWVITHPERRASIERSLEQNPNSNLRFIWVTTNHPLDPWKPGRSERGIRIHYVLWLSAAYKRAEEVCRNVHIDVAHHVSLGTVGAPPPLWRLPVSSVWGPIGGGQTTNPRYLGFFGSHYWLERVRTARVKALPLYSSFRRAARRCRAVFATNRETADLLKRAGASRIEMMLDCGLPEIGIPGQLPAPVIAPHEFTMLWAGRLEYRKGLELGLRAMARTKDTRIRLLVAGSGPQKEQLATLAQELGIGKRVSFLGAVPYDQMPTLFQSASAFFFTSLRDSFGSVVLEAMAHGLPVLTLDHQGVGSFLPDDAATKVQVSTPNLTINALSAAIEYLAASPDVIQTMRVAAWNFAREHTWNRRAARMSQVYEGLANSNYESSS
jgi:glycosyltransferase involved in cell wall biosynthesis